MYTEMGSFPPQLDIILNPANKNICERYFLMFQGGYMI